MNSVDLDRILLEKATRNISVIPQLVDQQFEETLLQLPILSTIRRKIILKRLMWAAACVSLLVGGFVLSVKQSPEVSIEMQKVPIIGAAISKISDFREWSVSDQGITMIVDRVRDDGRIVSADMTFRSPKNLDQTTINYLLKMNDTIVTVSRYAMIRSTAGSNILQATLQESLLKPHNESYNFNLFVTQIGDKRGKWFLSVPVVKDKNHIITIKPNQEKSTNEIGLKLNGITLSPLSTEINVDYVKKQNPKFGWGYELVDDSGVVQVSDASINYYLNNEIQGAKGNESHLFGPVTIGSKSVRIIPFAFVPEFGRDEMKASKKTLERTPTESEPIKLNQGKTEMIFVTGIEFKQDRTLVRIRMEGSNPTLQIKRIFLENKSGISLAPLSTPQLRLYEKECTLEFPATSPDITFVAWPVYSITLKPELQFKLNIPR